jgi:hypothetical protein
MRQTYDMAAERVVNVVCPRQESAASLTPQRLAYGATASVISGFLTLVPTALVDLPNSYRGLEVRVKHVAGSVNAVARLDQATESASRDAPAVAVCEV